MTSSPTPQDAVTRSTTKSPAPQDKPSGSARTREALGAASSKRHITNVLATVMVYAAFLIALIPLVWVLFTVIKFGARVVVSPTWWQQSQAGITSYDPGGGAYHAIIGTLITSGVATLISVPVGILTAIYLVEYGRGRLARTISFTVDILTGVPSIVAALFIYAVAITTLGSRDRTGFLVGLALVLLMVPVVVRSTEEMLKLVPNELREASYALGVPKWKTITSIVLPTAFSGIVTGVLLGVARVMGETAPFLILGPYAKSINFNMFEGFMAALPTMIDRERTEATTEAISRAWGAALTLILIILLLNVIGRIVSRFSAVKK